MKISVFGLFVASLSLILSGIVYWENRPSMQLKRDQDQHMRMALNSAYFLTFFIAEAYRLNDAGTDADDMEQVYAVIQSRSQLLERIIQESFSLGLVPDIIGEHDRSAREFIALSLLLNQLSTLNPSEFRIEDNVSRIRVCILARLLDQIVKYEHRGPLFRGEEIEGFIEVVQNELDCPQWSPALSP